MTKLLHLGMPIEKIIQAVTSAPAHALGESLEDLIINHLIITHRFNVLISSFWLSWHCAGTKYAEDLGSFQIGLPADITVCQLVDVDVDLEDCHKQYRRIRQRIVPKMVFRAGSSYPISLPEPWPNPASGKPQDLAGLVVKDPNWQQIMAQHGCC